MEDKHGLSWKKVERFMVALITWELLLLVALIVTQMWLKSHPSVQPLVESVENSSMLQKDTHS